jgi:hypothetical protein
MHQKTIKLEKTDCGTSPDNLVSKILFSDDKLYRICFKLHDNCKVQDIMSCRREQQIKTKVYFIFMLITILERK